MKKLFLVLLTVAACGRYVPQSNKAPIEAIPCSADRKVTVAVFGAPWCGACKSEIPKLNAALSKLPEAERAKIDFRLYLTTGGNSAMQANQSEADKYKAYLKLSQTTAAPDPWQWTLFRKYVGGSLMIPGAAVLSADGKVLKSFRGGATFDVSEIARFAAQASK